MIFEHYHWKKAKAKKQPYKFKWNEYMDKDHKDSYYVNWPVYFPFFLFLRIGNKRGSYARFSKLKDLCTSLDNWMAPGKRGRKRNYAEQVQSSNVRDVQPSLISQQNGPIELAHQV
ncbi:hypothetical protein CRYUN_Cryun11dG0099500 [Craigia yunnanensis]